MIFVRRTSTSGQRIDAGSRIDGRPECAPSRIAIATLDRSDNVSASIIHRVLLALFFLLPATALLLGVFSSEAAFGQQTSPGSSSTNGNETNGNGGHSLTMPPLSSTGNGISRIEEVPLQTYLLPDENGKLQPVIGWSFKELLKAHNSLQALTPHETQPRSSFQHLSATGRVEGDRAILDIQVRLTLREETWVSVPLHLNEAILREPLADSPDHDQDLRFDKDGDGWVLWIRGAAGQHQTTLKTIVPLRKVGDQTHLRLFLPRTTSSEIRLTVPKTKLAAQVSEGATLQPASERGGSTELVAMAQGGDFQLTWSETQGRPAAELRQTFEVMETLLTQINRGNIVTEGTLSVRGFGAPFDRIAVRLPENATLVSDQTNDYTITLLPDAESSVGRNTQLAEVRLNQKTSGPVEIQLAVSQPLDIAVTNNPIPLTGFEVVDAVRQWGHVAVTAPSGWQILWQSTHGARRVDQLPESLGREDVVAGFAIDVAAYQLIAKLVQKQTRIDVEPEYLVSIFEDRQRLTARLNYTVRGADVDTLRLKMSGWEMDSVGPTGPVDQDGIIKETDDSIVLPLVQPQGGRFELKLTASRKIDSADRRLEFSLPKPQVDSSGPLAIVLAPADNILLIPDDKATKGMTRQPVASTLSLPKLQQDPLQYRGDSLDASFAADLRVLSRKISAESVSKIELKNGTGSYEQNLSYTILNEPTDHFDVILPRGLFESGMLEFLLGDSPLQAVILDDAAEPETDDSTPLDTDVATSGPATALAENTSNTSDTTAATEASDAADNSKESVRVRISLPEAKIGFCRILARYPLTWNIPTSDQSTTISIENIIPVTDQSVRNELTITTLPRFEATLDTAGWIRTNGTDSSHVAEESRSQKWISTETPPTIELTLQATGEQLSQTLIVDRAWIKTWLTRTARQDRTVMAITTRADHMRMLIPRGATVAQVMLKPNTSDGQWQEAKWEMESAEKMRISLPGGADQVQRYIIELRTYFIGFRRSEGEVSVELPGVESDVWLRRLYWQVILPKNEHPVTDVSGFTPEHVWGWNGYFFSRRPTMDQAMLEAWAGGIHEKHPPTGVNSYLFGAFGNVRHCHLRTGSRTWIVLAASSIVLMVGMLLIYVPAIRHPILLLSGSISLLAFGAVYPEPTLLLAQAGALGFILLLVAGLLQYGMRLRRTNVFDDEHEHGSTQTQIPNGSSEPSSTRLAAYNESQSVGSGSITATRPSLRSPEMSGSSHSSRPLR